MSEDHKDALKEKHLEFAKSTNNRVWELLEKQDRTPKDDEDMLLASFSPLYHWKHAGSAVHTQRGCWMISRAYLALDRAEQSKEWALKCLEVTENNPGEMAEFDLAYAQEGLARVYALIGDYTLAQQHYDLALELGDQIKDPEDQKIFRDDLNGWDWNEFSPK